VVVFRLAPFFQYKRSAIKKNCYLADDLKVDMPASSSSSTAGNGRLDVTAVRATGRAATSGCRCLLGLDNFTWVRHFTRKMAAAHKYATQAIQSFRSSSKNGSADEANTLLTIADEARANAYAPYSNFHVGAAVLCEDGSIVTGISLR